MKTKKSKTNKKVKNKTQKIQPLEKIVPKKNLQLVSPANAFKYFIENSTFSYYSRGFCGILVLAKLKEGYQSPYRHIRTNGIAHVKYLLLKFFEIKSPSDSSDIQREINIQQTIYMSSLRSRDTLLEPICPCIVYSHSEALPRNYKESFYEIMNQTTQNNIQIDQVFQQDVAFFAMEFMENYAPLSKYINTFSETTSTNICLYTLDKLHALGVMHNDFHDDNVLLVHNYNYFGFDKDTSTLFFP